MWIVFLVLLLTTVFLDWYAVNKNNRKIIYFAKPAIILILIGASFYYLSPLKIYVQFFIIGLILSLLGDILLMLAKDRFLFGLISFFFAQVSYIFALRLFPIKPNQFFPIMVLTVTLLMVVAQLIPRMRKELIRANIQKLFVPIFLYSINSAIFVLAALSHFYKSGNQALVSYMFSMGALLFLISDLALGWNRFIEQIPNAKLKIHISYHLAQILLTLGFIFKYS